MNTTDYWVLAKEYSIWNATVAALQFWTADLEAHVLSSATEQVYNIFFYTTSMHLLCQQSEEVLFSHFTTMLNEVFESKHALEDEGYGSGSENFNIPTPLRCTPRIHHVSSDDNTSIDPTTPCSSGTSQSYCKPICHQLSFNSSEDEEGPAVDISPPYSTTSLQNLPDLAQQLDSIYPICGDLEVDEEDEDFQTVPLDDDHWPTEEIPETSVYTHSLPHPLCPYPCPYMDYTSTSYHDTLDLSDISEFEDLMTTSSDEDIPALDDEIRYWNLWTMVST